MSSFVQMSQVLDNNVGWTREGVRVKLLAEISEFLHYAVVTSRGTNR